MEWALSFAWAAWKRFPEDVVARTGLAEVLKVAGRYADAEAIYRETVERFPENVVARNGLAEVLKVAGRYAEAEAIYRETIERFPQDVVARNGLADTLRRAGRLWDAEDTYRETRRSGRFDVATLVALAHLLIPRGGDAWTEANQLLQEALGMAPRNPYVRELQRRVEEVESEGLDTSNAEWDELLDRVRWSEAPFAAGESAAPADEEPTALHARRGVFTDGRAPGLTHNPTHGSPTGPVQDHYPPVAEPSERGPEAPPSFGDAHQAMGW
jgi:tetratricopeptide (TPR) repeat protein